MRLREFLARPLGEQPRGFLALLGLIVVVAVASSVVPTGERSASERKAPADVPAPAIYGGAPGEAHPPVRPTELVRARRAARRFLRGYLAWLYARGRVREVQAITPRLRATLARARARKTPAQRRRRPRVVALDVIGQSRGAVIATARVADGGTAPYSLSFNLTRRHGDWIVSDLASD